MVSSTEWFVSSNINKCNQNTFNYLETGISLRARLYLTSFHVVDEAAKDVVYNCFIVCVENDGLFLFEIMFHVLFCIVSGDWKLNK